MSRFDDENMSRSKQPLDEQSPVLRILKSRAVKIAGGGLGALILLNSSTYNVSPNDRANVRHFGKPKYSGPVGAGLHFKWPLVDDVDKVQTALTTQEIKQIDVGTVDNQRVKLDINFNYTIPDSQVDHVLYDVGGVGNKNIADQVEKTVESVAVAVIAAENMNSLNSRLEAVREEMQRQTSEQLSSLYGIKVDRLQIKAVTPSDSFLASNANAVNAKNAAVAAENQLKTVQFEAQQVEARAKGAADAKIAEAEGNKQAAIKEAEGYSAQIHAFGSPAAYNDYLRAQAAQKWNGTVPQVVTGVGNGGGANIVVPIGGLKP